VTVGVESTYADPLCGDLDRRWQAQLCARRLFQNDLFITLLARPPKGKAGVPEKWRATDGPWRRGRAIARELRHWK